VKRGGCTTGDTARSPRAGSLHGGQGEGLLLFLYSACRVSFDQSLTSVPVLVASAGAPPPPPPRPPRPGRRARALRVSPACPIAGSGRAGSGCARQVLEEALTHARWADRTSWADLNGTPATKLEKSQNPV